MIAHYFLGSRLLGVGPALPWSETYDAISSLVYICPTCGDAWGRMAVTGCEWLPIRRGCAAHPFLDRWGGSFIHPWLHSSLLAALPPEVLTYEFTLRTLDLHDI